VTWIFPDNLPKPKLIAMMPAQFRAKRHGHHPLLASMALILRAMACCLLVLVLLGMTAARASAQVQLNNEMRYPLGRQMMYFADPGGKMQFQDVMASKQFRAVRSDEPNFGFSHDTYWFRFELVNQSARSNEWYLESQYAVLDYIDAWLVYPDNRIVPWHSGDMLPFSQRSIPHRNPIFPLHLAKGERVTVYLRAKTAGSVQVRMVLWHPQALLERDRKDQMIFGLFYGILLSMFLYNLMIYLAIRDISYFHYLHYLFNYALVQLTINGLAFEYLWPQFPAWGNIALPFFVYLSLVGMLEFSRSFMDMKATQPGMNRIMRGLSLFFLALVPCAFFVPYAWQVYVCVASAVAIPLLIFYISAIALRLKVRQAKYFLLAWSALLIGVMLFALASINVLPTIFITEYGLQIGSALEVVLLSAALVNRMQSLKEENQRIQREATETLEQRVKVRTQKLEEANQELEQAFTSLRNMQQDLIRSEKMAALGSLVGGIAHELNTPIGNSITMGSSLLAETNLMLAEVQTGQVRLQTAKNHLEDIGMGIEVLMRNLERAAELVSSFKQVAVDRATDQVRRFDVKHALEEIVLTLWPLIRGTPYRLELDLADDIEIESYPGPLGQIITNFVNNAILHGFDGRGQGCMYLSTRCIGADKVEITFSDDGKGMAAAHLKRIFEPFFTTRLGQGGSGLGMHIVYNLVMGRLQGQIDVKSEPDHGTTLTLLLPRKLAATSDTQAATPQQL
jgi:signal transduction histidine kinase